MIVNGRSLYKASPIDKMLSTKCFTRDSTHGLGEAGYDICIKQDITFTRDFFLRRCVESIDYGEDEEGNEILIHRRDSGKFVLASSKERFQMPPHLVGIVHDKSTWARRGVSVFNTVIEPGWHGYLTLELVYHGWRDLHIPAGTGIAQVIFHELTHWARYEGRYQNQANEPVPAIEARQAADLFG